MSRVLDNYVRLEEGITKELHFYDHYFAEREIRDPVTQRVKKVRVLIMRVDEEDGRKVDKEFSVMAEKLALQLMPYIQGGTYRNYKFRILKTGKGFTTEYTLTAIPMR
jgi:hypothetical protein